MAIKRPQGPAGTLVVLEHVSRILKANPLKEPHVRRLGEWLPPQYDDSGKKRFPRCSNPGRSSTVIWPRW
jgi:hypothetical protein